MAGTAGSTPVLDLNRWSIFSLLPSDFVAHIKMANVFGNMGNEAIIVTRDDEVYSLGCNGVGAGTGETRNTLLPVRIAALCNKKVKGFAFGSGPHVLAYTETGDLYTWGHNGYCQLGNGSTNQVPTPTLLTASISGKLVVEVACGSHHSLIRTDEGEVFGWGQNNCGQVGVGSTTNQPTPRKLTGALVGKKVVQVACGQTSSMALSDCGEVFGWGYNSNGQLGLNNSMNQLSPCLVNTLQNAIVVQLACGYAHTLALTDEGIVYAWGANSCGQLGSGSKANMSSPVRVAKEIGRVVEVAAMHSSHISAAQVQSTKVYMWGQCRGQYVTKPMETPFVSTQDVFACFSCPMVTWRPLEVDTHTCNKMTDSMRMAFDDPNTSDLRFVVEGKPIHVHRVLLCIRCEHFAAMFQNQWQETDKDVVEITQFSYPVYRAFLNYLYTDRLDVNPEEALGLLDLANSYCEQQLKRQCEQLIKQGILIENAAMLYSTAIKYSAKELEEFCFRFLLNHMTAVTQTEAFSHLEEDIVKNFVRKAAQSGAFKS